MIIRCYDRKEDFPEGTPVRECLRRLGALDEDTLAAQRGGVVAELNEPLIHDCRLVPLTLRDEEGRRIYERSLRFVMLLALKHLYPYEQVRIEYSVGYGVFVRLPYIDLHRQDIVKIENEMRRITELDLPFEKRQWSRDDAIAYFRAEHQDDKVELLSHRPIPWFNMYCCDGMWEYFYGAMTASTGCVKVFTLFELRGGFVLQLPNGSDLRKAAPYMYRPKHLSVFSESALWCEYLNVQNVADLYELCDEKRFRNFIRVNEALHSARIDKIAETIAEKEKHIVLVAGPSSSGKTTFAGRLAVHLQSHGVLSRRISMDNWFIERDSIPVGPDGTRDYETPDVVDLELLHRNINDLLEGEEVALPTYNFTTGKREYNDEPVTLQYGEVLIVEGIHGMNPKVAAGFPEDEIYRIFVSALTCLNLDDHNRIRTTDVRLLRRLVRDNCTRGYSPAETLAGWASVRQGEEKWIFAYQEEADVMFNTALHYELPVLKKFSYDLLKEIPADSPEYLLSRRLIKTLNYMPDIDDSVLGEIPPLSLLREFIGGCTLEEE
ncbi:MAG: nucleoside kinase [Clostridia bacterium]|nr:nucleoside kinase [Clostridia bacterium]